MTMSKTECQNSIWIKFGDCSKNAILGSRTHFFFFFSLRDFFPRILNTFPMLRFRWNFANVFSTSFPRVVFLGFWIFKIFFEKLHFFCRSGLRNFFRHPYYMVPPTLNTFLMLRFRWNFAYVFTTSFPRLLFLGFGFSKYFSKNFRFFAALDLEKFSVIHTIWSPDIKRFSHAPISMKLRKRVLHIIPQGLFSRFLDFQNIFRKNISFFAALDLENFSAIHTIWFPRH